MVLNGRDAGRLAGAAAALASRTKTRVRTVAADLNTADGRARLLAACPDADILVNNNAGPPPGDFADWDHAAWLAAVEANMLAPILLIRRGPRHAGAPVRPHRQHHLGHGEVAAAAAGALQRRAQPGSRRSSLSWPRGGRRQCDDQQPAARALRHRPAEQQAPGRGQPRRSEDDAGPGSIAARHPRRPVRHAEGVRRGLRLPVPARQAGYITGQNLLLDGGEYPGL